MRRIRYGSVRQFQQQPLEPNTPQESTPQLGAVVAKEFLPKEDAESRQNLIVPVPFDWQPIVAAPASGSTTWLIADNNNTATVAGAVQSGPVPYGMRGVVDGIFPYLEGAAGQITQPRIPGVGVTITWSIMISGRPDSVFGAITKITASWSVAMSDRMLISLKAGDWLTCNVTNVDPSSLYTYLGIRVKGWWIPLTKEQRAR